MTDDPHHAEAQEQAASFALGALGEVETEPFEQAPTAASSVVQRVAGAFQDMTTESAFGDAEIAPPSSLKARLMARIAAEPQELPHPSPFVFVRASDGEWREVEPGLSVKVLFYDSVGGRVTTLMRLAPGVRLAAHRHMQVEELYVLEGGCVCAGAQLQAGDYHRAEARTVHPVTYSEHGCLALVMTSSNHGPIG